MEIMVRARCLQLDSSGVGKGRGLATPPTASLSSSATEGITPNRRHRSAQVTTLYQYSVLPYPPTSTDHRQRYSPSARLTVRGGRGPADRRRVDALVGPSATHEGRVTVGPRHGAGPPCQSTDRQTTHTNRQDLSIR